MSPRAALGALALVAALCAAAGFFLARVTAPASSLRPLGTAGGQPAPLEAAPAPPPRRIPERLPALALPDLAGKDHLLAEFAGRAVLVNFWAPWCEPCRREIPLLEEVNRDPKSSGLEIVGIALDSAGNVGKYVKEQHISYPIRVADRQAFEAVSAFGMDAVLPFTVFADGQGEILTLKVGELRRGELSLLVGQLLEVQAGRKTLAAAREALRRALPQVNAQLASRADTDPAR